MARILGFAGGQVRKRGTVPHHAGPGETSGGLEGEKGKFI